MRFIACAAMLLGVAACGGAEVARRAEPTVKAADPRAAQMYMDAVQALGRAKPGDKAAEDAAIASFEQAITIDPTLWEAHYNLGVLLRRRGELRKALPHLQRAHELDRGAGEPLIALAEVQHALGDRDEAAELLTEYMNDHPEANQVRIALTAILRERGAYDQALDSARKALVREPANVAGLLEIGRIYRAKGDLDVAELVFQKALALEPKNAAAQNDLGLIALARGDTQRAFDAFEKATAFDAQFIPARMNRASVLLRAGDYASARSEYAKLLEVAADRLDARVALGISLRGLNKPDEAEAEYKKVLDTAPNHAAALFNLAILRADFQQRRSDAKPLFERYLEVSAEDDPERMTAERYVREISAETEHAAADSKATTK
jgi:tetratricopeptide (TPR) repeat protein